MFYTLNHKDKVEQGDICCNLPKFLPSDLIPEEPTISTWDIYIKSLRENLIPKVKFSIFPSPTLGIVLTQTCDIENAKPGSSILFAELRDYQDYFDIEELPSNNRKEKYIDKIVDILRNEPAKHYLPELILNNNEVLGPWEADFKTIFFVPADLIKINKEIFWKARLISPGLEVLKEKISRFFTRLAFDECLYFSNIENKYYIGLKNRNKEENIKLRKDYGFSE